MTPDEENYLVRRVKQALDDKRLTMADGNASTSGPSRL